jgi:hypothetical protein
MIIGNTIVIKSPEPPVDQINYDFGDAAKALQVKLATFIAGSAIDIPVKWYGGAGKFTTPDNAPWMRDTITVLDEIQDPCRWKRTEGFYTIDLFYPDDSGINSMYDTAKQLRVLFENKVFSNVKTMNVELNPLPDEKPWLRLQLNINFYTEGM